MSSQSISCSPQDGTPLELLDEYWFFSNTLANSNNKPPRSSAKDREQHRQQQHRLLLRTPSLPSPHVGMMEEMPNDRLPVAGSGRANRQQQQPEAEHVEVDDDDLNWSSIYEGVLRTRMAEGGRSALRRAPSMPVPYSAGEIESRRRRSEVRSPSASQPRQQQEAGPVLPRSRSVFHSSSDLESIEVQGFRDLGFVFHEAELRESLAGVLPGLKQAKSTRSRSSSGRPYLSEAWQQRPPALVRSEARSAAEMKDQLRMWAQAVACNVRQEC
ncbi:uncharacterized protein LOC120705441 [Panicum virgatum]|uniref:Uncharacterized protein n=1 Tax=Panicum virgatum TaxID=38727 RepID=A0A8T0S7I2_PANVG|nr:uncharacterized protein LOC120705441 [Panicum virgatum]KAG2594561.1 hypothetical protein PVAP13_5KG000200 [Panicum virgatum]